MEGDADEARRLWRIGVSLDDECSAMFLEMFAE
jgi:hypothetical protein